MANRILGIEFSKDRTHIVEVGPGRRIKIFNFAIVDGASVEPERRIEQLQHTLRIRGFEAKDVILAVSGAGIEHRLLTLPPLSDRELQFVMQREAKKVAVSPDSLWSYVTLKTKEELGIKKDQILLVTAEQATVTEARDRIAPTKLKIHQITTVAEALLNLMRQAGIFKKDSARMMVHFGGGRMHVVFAQDGVLLLSRDITVDYENTRQEEQVSRLITEVRRSLLFFRQNFPQSALDQILFSGESDIIGSLSTRSKEEIGIDSGILRFDELLDQTAFRGDWGEFRYHLPTLAVAIGAAWRRAPGTGINLLGGQTSSNRRSLNLSGIGKYVAAGLLAITALTGVYYFSQRGSLDGLLEDLESRQAQAQLTLDQAGPLQQQQAIAQARSTFLKGVASVAEWTELLRALSFVVPDTALFESIQVEAAPKPTMVIRGHLRASMAQANADFTRFFNGLRSLPYFSSVTVSKPLSVVSQSSQATPVAAARSSQVSFEVRCELISKN
jgi:Tfp pilus assembly PilM family ATPase